jgi:hypothetical protein
VQEALESEKERSRVREQEAFTARYQIVGVQEQLEQALERIKVVEQERDAFKTAAQNEEVARIAAEGRIPLPKNEDPEDEFASPKKPAKSKRKSGLRVAKDSRVSLSAVEILSSEASELEIEELRFQIQAERQRAQRAQEMVDFLQAECQMHCCPCSRDKSKTSASPQKPAVEAEEHHQSVIVHEVPEEAMHIDVEEVESVHEEGEEAAGSPQHAPRSPQQVEEAEPGFLVPRSRKEPRRSTIFCPKEGIFRTVSEQEAEALQAHLQEMEETHADEYEMQVEEVEEDIEPEHEPEREARFYARTPSVEPPAFALLAQQRTSLLSLLDAPSGDTHSAPLPTIPSIPTMPDTDDEPITPTDDYEQGQHHQLMHHDEDDLEPVKRPHTSIATYSITTTTTTVPVRDETRQLSSSFGEKLRTPSSGSNASFDLNNPALTPTMTREQALAKIRERRGRARSVEKKTAATTASAVGVAHKKTSADRVDRRTASGLARKPSKGR